ncbi:MAG: DUF808 domain-containing protein [Deltaproteobacteria bacterium]|nr:DUF808 domain-containing protein [Deltaproteobacteria bacterium]
MTISSGATAPTPSAKASRPAEALEANCPAEALEAGDPAEVLEIGGQIETLKTGGQIETLKAGGQIETLESGGQIETLKANCPAEALEASRPAEALEASCPAEALKAGGQIETLKAGGSAEALGEPEGDEANRNHPPKTPSPESSGQAEELRSGQNDQPIRISPDDSSSSPDSTNETSAVADPDVLVEDDRLDLTPEKLEKEKIKGAVRTDFVLSTEIIILTLGSLPLDASLPLQAGILAVVGALMTFVVYGFVAGIVKLDDLGLWLSRRSQGGSFFERVGRLLIGAAPWLMRLLTVVGTTAMFLVGGGILIHNLPLMSSARETLPVLNQAFDVAVGLFVGLLLLPILNQIKHLKTSKKS